MKQVRRLGIFVFYDSEGRVDDYIIYLLSNIMPLIERLVVVVNGNIDTNDEKVMRRFSKEIIIRENKGLDVAGWKYALTNYLGWDNVIQYDELVLFNDTFFGPFSSFENVFEKMSEKNIDFWGITCHWRGRGKEKFFPNGIVPEHIQSYFCVIKHKLLIFDRFQDYWNEMQVYDSYDAVVANHEARFTKYFSDLGFTWDTFVNTNDRKSDRDEKNYNTLIIEPYQMISIKKCPVLKIRTFGTKLSHYLNFDRGKELMESMKYLRENTDYPVDYIWQHILRKYSMSDVFYSLGLQYIVPTKFLFNEKSYITERVLVACHIYYEDQIKHLCKYLVNVPKEMDVIVTTDSDKKAKDIFRFLHGKTNPHIKIEIVPNKGRDVASLLVAIRPYVKYYDYICFLHDKKTSHALYTSGRDWQELLWCNMLASEKYIYNVLQLFKENPRMGIAVPPIPFCGSMRGTMGNRWYENKQGVKNLRFRLSITVPYSEESEGVITIGTVFWCRRGALQKLWDEPWGYDDFLSEPFPIDGTISHAVERILPQVAQENGFYTAWIMTPEDANLEARNARYLLERAATSVRSGLLPVNEFGLNVNLFQYDLLVEDRKIVVYGAGRAGQALYRQMLNDGLVKIVAVVDKNAENINVSDIVVEHPSVLKRIEFDNIIISIKDKDVAKEARDSLLDMGIPNRKIIPKE